MSKAMDALEVLEIQTATARNILRDYITTTEAERDGALGLLRIHGIPEERAVTIANGIEVLATRYQKSALDDAARIKELEEALKRIDVRKDDDAWWIHVDGKPHAGILRLSEKPSMCADAFIEWEAIRKAALSGARKVNSLGSVCGDEHLRVFLPDAGTRKVEP